VAAETVPLEVFGMPVDKDFDRVVVEVAVTGKVMVTVDLVDIVGIVVVVIVGALFAESVHVVLKQSVRKMPLPHTQFPNK
jgi:hypothetical protein